MSWAKKIWDSNPDIVELIAKVGEPIGAGPTLGYARVFTFRTPDLLLSSAQDYKGEPMMLLHNYLPFVTETWTEKTFFPIFHLGGYTAGQQHVWQATFDIRQDGSIFSHQPLINKPDNSHVCLKCHLNHIEV